MDLWHPRSERVIPSDGRTGLSFFGVSWKIVLHTTETDGYSPDRASYYGNPYWPHATITAGTIYQHLPIDVGGYALYSDGSVQTNRANAVQCEIVWRAANGEWPDDLLDTVADWVRWVQERLGVPIVIAEMFREGVTVASVASPIRFGDQEWLDFSGICGHSNVPGGNDHWDPGRLPVDRLKALLDPTPPPRPPTPQEALTMQRQLVNGGADYLWLGPERIFTRITTGGVFDVLKAGDDVPRVEVDAPTLEAFKAWAKNAGFTG